MTPIETHYLLGMQTLKIQQDSDYLPFSLDSILLADFFTEKKRMKNILDLGTGAGPIPLYLTTKTALPITGIDIQKPLIDLAKKNVKINNLEHQITCFEADIKSINQYFNAQSFDAVIVNPPFFKMHENSPLNDQTTKRIMRHEIAVTWEDILRAAKAVLTNQGQLFFVHRIERFTEILTTLKAYEFSLKRMRFVYPKATKNATSFLVEATLKGQVGLTLDPPLIVHDAMDTYTQEVRQIFHYEEH